jgi:hypothetical protein
MWRRIVLVFAALALVAGCSDGKPAAKAAAPSAAPKKGATLSLPSQILGLQVHAEDIGSQLARVKQLYLDSVGLFSFREKDDLLRATLQVSRFNELAEPDVPKFRNSVVANLGSTVPQELRVGEAHVWLTTGNQQLIFVWFQRRSFMVLSIRGDYPFPRTLLRKLLDADIKV